VQLGQPVDPKTGGVRPFPSRFGAYAEGFDRGFTHCVMHNTFIKRHDMKTPTSTRSRAERRDRALHLRRRITATVAAAGVTGVGVVGFLVAQSATSGTTSSAVATVTAVGDDSIFGDDGASKASGTLATGTASSGSATKATTVSGGSTVVVKKP
jgi:hypothetical protein